MTLQSIKSPSFDFSKTESQALIVHSIRFTFLVIVFLLTLVFQFLESRVVAVDLFRPLYILMGVSFLFQVSYLSFFKWTYKSSFLTIALFFYEALYVTGLIYYVGIQQSLLIFLYLVNLIMFAILYQRKGAMVLALWTSILFSLIVSLDTNLEGNTAYLAVGVNNLAFFTVAFLAGFLSEQLNLVGEQLKEKARDVRLLKNLNDLILQNISLGMLTIDQDENVIQSNPQAYRLTGTYQNPNESGKKLSFFFPDLKFQSDLSEFDHVLDREGEKRVFKMNLSPLRDEEGTPQGSILSFQDQTHFRNLEKRVRQSEKMAAIGQLAAGIAHEIRNPLAGISGSIQLLQNNAQDMEPEQTAKLMAIVLREIDRLNLLITEFLDYARPEAPMEDHVDLSKLVEEIRWVLSNDSRYKSVPIEVSADKDEVTILGNRDKLKQAFLNIIVNAVQACETVSLARVKIRVRREGQRVHVAIQDSGSGMKPEMKERIFEPFFTTKSKGTGLGLAVTHSILNSHHAEVTVESELGQGTEFNLYFKGL